MTAAQNTGKGRISPGTAALTALFACLTALGAFIRIPLQPVPLTLQVPAVLLAGVLLGPRYGALSQAVYIVIGLAGLPVFAEGGGFGYLLKPTFGYLVGFAGGAAATGAVLRTWRRAGLARILAGLLAGLGVIYLVGVVWLYFNLTMVQQKDITLLKAAWLGFLLPLPQDLLKIVLLALLIKRLQGRPV